MKGTAKMKMITTGLMTMVFAVGAFATEPVTHTVEMWNKDPENSKRRMVFSEEIVAVQPGDIINFLATDKGHNVEFIDGPEGVDLGKRSKLNEDVEVSFDEPGVYVYVCSPHASMGMIGIITVGEVTPEAIEAVQDAKLRGKGKKKFKELMEELND